MRGTHSMQMLEYALGMVETRGLIGSIEAADVMVKTANVRVLNTEYLKNGFVTIKIIGEVAAVKAAVDAASAAAARVGQVIATHVIPRPAEEVEPIIKQYDKGRPSPLAATAEPARPKTAPNRRETKPVIPTPVAHDDEYGAQLQAMSVHQLRALARAVGGLSIMGRQISRANKDVLIRELMQKRTKG